MLVGLTGQIGSGKSTAAAILASLGAAVIDADRIARQVVADSPALLRKLVRAFGPEILTPSGKLSRKKLARSAFSAPAERRKLNDIIHPYILREMRREMRQKARSHEVVVIDAPLLLDRNLDRETDFVLVIHAGLEKRLDRLARRGIARQDALARQRMQLPYRTFQARADRVILNSGSPESLEKRLHRFFREILQKRLTNS